MEGLRSGFAGRIMGLGADLASKLLEGICRRLFQSRKEFPTEGKSIAL